MFFRSQDQPNPQAIERDLTHPSERVREAAARELGRVSPDFPGLSDRLGRAAADVSPFVRTAAMYSILEQNLENSLREIVLQALDDSSSRVREAAVIALARMEDESTRGRLESLIEDEDPAVRHAALLSAAEKGFFDLRDRMEARLAGDPDDEVRAAAAAALGECRPLPEEPLRRAALMDPNREVRFEAAMALAQAKMPGSAKLLVPFLEHEDLFNDSAQQLCRLGDASVRPDVERLYGRRFQPAVRKLLLGALLSRLGDDRARAYMEKKTRALFLETRVWAIHALGLAQTPWAQKKLAEIASERPGSQEAETAIDALMSAEKIMDESRELP